MSANTIDIQQERYNDRIARRKSGEQIHLMLTHLEAFRHIQRGTRIGDFRRAEKSFKVGDTLIFREYNRETAEYTGNELTFYVTASGKIDRTLGFVWVMFDESLDAVTDEPALQGELIV